MAVGKNLIMEKVSIVVPLFNAENTIETCIRSLTAQTYTNLEILLIDDGSMDNSLSICRNLQAYDQRIRIFHHTNHGVSYTRNIGIDKATGDYLMFVDGDDELLPDSIATYVDVKRNSEADVVIGGITVVSPDGSSTEKLPKSSAVYGNEIWNKICTDDSGLFGYVPNKLYDLNIIKENHIQFNTDFFAQEDLDFALSVYHVCTRFCTISYSGYLYNYAAARTKHPYTHYIMNKVKMYEYGEQGGQLNNAAKAYLIESIESLIYVALYYSSKEEFDQLCRDFRNITGLKSILQSSGRLKITTRLLLSQQDPKLRRYMKIRKNISKILHHS